LTGGTLTGGLIGTTGSFSSSGSGDTFTIGHTIGSGIALNITKNGNGEGLYINKASGSGNAATIVGNLGGTSATFSSTLGVTGALSGTSATFSGSVTVSSASTNGFIVNSTNGASYRGFTIQANGTTQGGIELLPNTGEIRIGGYSTTSDYFPVIYSDGVAALTFGIGAAPSATFSSRVTADNMYINATSAPALGSPKLFVKMASANSYEGLLVASSSNNNVIAIAHTGSIGLITTNYGTGGTNTNLGFGTGGATQMTLDTSGNLGLGVTPSAFSTYKALQIGAYSSLVGQHNDTRTWLSNNAYFDGTNWRYIVSGPCIQYNLHDGEHRWYNAPSGTAGNAISFTQAMTLTSGGNVGINSPNTFGWRLRVVGSSTTNSSFGAEVVAGTSNLDSAFSVRNILDSVLFQVRGDGLLISRPLISTHTTSSGANMYVDPSNGAIYRSTSSLKYKKNVEDYTKGLDVVMQLRPVSYEGKNEIDNGRTFAGLIAEEVHELGLTEYVQYAEDGTPDALAYQNMIALAFKAIQELKAEIDELKAK
jgi:hypothetical protein